MSRRDVMQLVLLLLIPAGCAGVGWLLGRLIRGRRPQIERERPRIATSAAYLRDAHDATLSAHTRVRCAFEAVYFCCCEIAESRGMHIDGLEHPNPEVVEAGLCALDVSTDDRFAAERLTKWTVGASPFLPELSVDDACRLAERICARTTSMLT